jgi:hypothetical protein
MLDSEAKKRRAAHIQRQLDEALEGTFPASDPVAIVTSQDEEDWEDQPKDAEQKPGAGQSRR